MNPRAQAICDAFAADEFAAARHLWEDYADDLHRSIAAGTATKAMLAEALEVLERSRIAAKVFRARAMKTLGCTRAAQAYSPTPASAPHMVRISG